MFNSKSVFLIFILVISNPVHSSQEIVGEYTTMNGSECDSEIIFFENGEGFFIDSCRNEEGLQVGNIYKNNISWQIRKGVLLVKVSGINEVFTYHSKLSCEHFGEPGNTNGLTGLDLYFWRKSVKCH